MQTVSIVIPTRNESENIKKLLQGIWDALIPYIPELKYEIVIVDDSEDNTSMIARSLGARVIKGQGKGLGQAIIDGIKNSQSDIVLVMDADLSHDPKSIPDLLRPIMKQGYDMTVGSRYISGGKTEGWEFSRRLISRCACLLALPITTVKDSTSGFFAFKKEILNDIQLEGKSWKIMLEIMVKAKPIRACEVPITFKVRTKGKSKFNKKQMIAYIKHLVSLSVYKYQRFLKFCVVGGTGSIITFALTYILTEYFNLWYIFSLVFAVLVATVSNFLLNSIWTFSVGKSMTDPDYEWRAYYKGNFFQKWWKRSITEKVLQLLPSNKGQLSIYDIGCGSSPMGIEIGSPNYIGVDSNKKKIDFMQKKGFPFKYSTQDVDRVNDVVMAIEVIEHCENDIEAINFIKHLSDKVKYNGVVIIATPDYSTWLWRFIEKVYAVLMPSAYANDHKVKFDQDLLVNNCKKFGLNFVGVKRVLGCDMVCKFVKRNS